MKTPQEAAKELVDKFWYLNKNPGKERLDHAKACALICVEEIIESIGEYATLSLKKEGKDYWQQVKEYLQTEEEK